MLISFFEPARRLFGLIESLVLALVVLIGVRQPTQVGDYKTFLNKSGVFENTAQQSLPQTATHDIVMNHFTKARGDGKIPKCLIIGYDGARADALLQTANDPQGGSHALKEAGGKIYQMYAGGKFPRFQRTKTACGWTSLLTGKWRIERDGTGHGIANNGHSKKDPEKPKLLFNSLLELPNSPVKKTAMVTSWDGHFSTPNASYVRDVAYGKEHGLGAAYIKTDTDEETFDRTKEEILGGVDFALSILEYCDHAGHGSGFGNQNPDYVQAMKDAEHAAWQLIQTVQARPGYAKEDWLILITSDHGGFAKQHNGQFAVERQIFLASNQPF
jgi:hypothetical protein